ERDRDPAGMLGFRCLISSGTPSPSVPGRVTLVSLTSPVSACLTCDADRLRTDRGRPARSSSPTSRGRRQPAGLYPQRASGGRITWTWMVDTRTAQGRWPIDVPCGAARPLHTSFIVV